MELQRHDTTQLFIQEAYTLLLLSPLLPLRRAVTVFVFPFPSLYEIITSLYIAVQSKIELICIEIERFCACLHSQTFFLFVHRQYHEKHRILARKIQHYRVHLRKRESRKQLLVVAVLF